MGAWGRVALWFLLALVPGSLVAGGETEVGTAPKLTLDIRVVGEVHRSGEPIFVECTISNVSDRSVRVPVMFVPDHHFVSFEIRDPHGRTVPFVGPERKAKIDDSVVFGLRPRMFVGQSVDVTGSTVSERWFEMTTPGTYRIRARYHVPPYLRATFSGPEIWTGTLVSNPETIEVE